MTGKVVSSQGCHMQRQGLGLHYIYRKRLCRFLTIGKKTNIISCMSSVTIAPLLMLDMKSSMLKTANLGKTRHAISSISQKYKKKCNWRYMYVLTLYELITVFTLLFQICTQMQGNAGNFLGVSKVDKLSL